LANARRKEREFWQGVVDGTAAERDTALAENERLRQQIALLTNPD